MQLHHPHRQPDWELRGENQRNVWQRIAYRTRGIITPGNIVSLAGIGLVLAGLYVSFALGTYVVGFLLVIAGRLGDLLDGILADITATKSMFGAQVDATIDKIAAFATIIIFARYGVMPHWLATLVAVEMGIVVLTALVARQRFVRLLPNRAGKLAAWFLWVGVLAFLLAYFALVPASWLRVITLSGYAIILLAILLAALAEAMYIRVVFGIKAKKYAALNAFDRYIIIRNPQSTESFRVSQRIQELHVLAPKAEIVIFDTVAGGFKKNAGNFSKLSEKLGRRTLLCVGGGDGTVNLAVTCLLLAPGLPPEARRTPILPLWCGNANDLAFMLSGHPTSRPIRKALRHGHTVRIRPMVCTFQKGRKTSEFLATSYASFGASAFATKEMERTLRSRSPIRRFIVSRFGQEVVAVLWALMRSPTFRVEENGKTRVIFERTHFNGSRFAKVIGLPLRLTDERFHRTTIEHKHLISLVLHVLGLVGDRQLSKKTITNDTFTVHDTIWAQFDGEPVQVPAGTSVRVSIAKVSFYALSTRLSRR